MYLYNITGIVKEIGEKHLIIQNEGFGYKIRCTLSALHHAKVDELFIELLIYQHITDDDETWYGFNEDEELELFKELIKVTGIGPAKAIMVLGYPVDVVKQALALEDRRLFLSIPGFGIRLTEKMFLEIGKKFQIK